MKTLLSSLGMLAGALLCVAGAVLLLVSGFDRLYGALGLLMAAAGATLAYLCRRASGGSTDQDGQRARQRSEPPPDAGSLPRRGFGGKNRRI